MGNWIKQQWQRNRSILAFIFLMLIFRSSFADWNDVPTGSMLPTIVEGDRILVNKLAYDVHLPFSNISVLELGQPKAGDIVIFHSQVLNKRLVKRVIGTPGDRIALVNNRLFINGKATTQTLSKYKLSGDHIEMIGNTQHQVRYSANPSSLANFTEILVPKGHYFVMGDNRDNSADSRVIGVIPRQEIIGRAQHVVFSVNYDNYFLPRRKRFLHTL